MNDTFLTVVLIVAPMVACGPAEQPQPPPQQQPPSCSASNCAGCCDERGVCQPGSTAQACGVSGASCSACPNGCEAGACRVMPDPLPVNAKLVFTSSLGLAGNFGGRTVANTHCANAAAAAGLPGTFVAWLSGTERCGTTNCDFAARDAVTGTGPWYLLCRDENGRVRQPFLNRAALLVAPTTPLDCDERGRKVSSRVWTGTGVGGGRERFAHCAGYSVTTGNAPSWTATHDVYTSNGRSMVSSLTATVGSTSAIDERWTSAGGAECADTNRFYCFQL